MLGRSAINAPPGSVGPPIVPVRATGDADVLPVAALRPVRAVDGVHPAFEELARAGIDVRTVLEGGADALVARALPTTAALSELLERARAAIVRGAAADALAALDEGWEGAERTEGGWYYRGAALTLLGLPGEADRVLQQGLVRRGGSVALHFLVSVVRSLQGDSAGARDALAQAQARRPADNVLLAWQSVLLARQGDQAGARQLLERSLADEPGSSVLSWAKRAISLASTESARASLAAQRQVGEFADTIHAAMGLDASLPDEEPWSALEYALRRLGARFVRATASEAAHDVRAVLQSLAAGGALDRSARPEQTVATRSMLVAMLAVLSRETSESARGMHAPNGRGSGAAQTPSLHAQPDAAGRWRLTPAVSNAALTDDPTHRPLAGARSAVLTAMRSGALTSAGAWLPRVSSAEGETAAAVLRLLLEGARRETTTEPRAAEARIDQWPEQTSEEHAAEKAHARVSSAAASAYPARTDDTLAVPIRIGLSLLQQSSARDEARTALAMVASVPFVAPPVAATAASGLEQPKPTSHVIAPRTGLSLRVLALVCMALAFTALVLGHGVLAIALAGGASWLALRSSAVAATARRRAREEVDQSDSATPVTDSPLPVTSDHTPR